MSVVGLLRCLKMEKTPQARVKAIAGLAQAGGTRPEVVAALIEAVNKDEAVSVRFTAVSALRHAAGHEAQTVPVLLKACQDTNAGMRSAALQTLGFIKGYDREVAAALVAALNDAHEQVRTTAETGLDHPQRAAFAVEPLARLVSAKPHQHLTAIHALTYALPGSALAKKTLLDVVTIDRKTYRSSGNSTRDKTILLLLQTIPDDEQVRAVFAEYLNLSETERNKSSLQQNVAARLNALNHVVKMGDRARPYVPRLVAFLQQEPPIHDDTTVPWFVVQSLGKLGPHAEEAIPALIDLLARDAVGYTFWAMPSSGHPELAYPAGIALARIGGKAIPALLRTLGEDREPRKRIGAANALGYCRADKDLVIPRLEAALKKLDEVKPETPRLKAQIEAALAMLRGATFQMPKPHEPKLN